MLFIWIISEDIAYYLSKDFNLIYPLSTYGVYAAKMLAATNWHKSYEQVFEFEFVYSDEIIDRIYIVAYLGAEIIKHTEIMSSILDASL